MASEMIFLYLFTNLAFQLPWQPIKFRGLDKNSSFDRGLLKEHFCKTYIKISAMNGNFHFSHYKSMETLSCHSIQLLSYKRGVGDGETSIFVFPAYRCYM